VKVKFKKPLEISVGDEPDSVILKIYKIEKFLIPKKGLGGRKMA
jgi:hypothetical protein